MDPQRPRERELVLAPNEYAYVLDTTKGHINCYVGPNKTSLAQTDQLVNYNARSGRFEHVELARAVQLFPTAPRNGYIVLENPPADGPQPKAGLANAMVELLMGEKINVRGPTSFALWPGQTAKMVDGHRLRSNQYLYVRIYDVAAARAGWNDAVGQPADVEPPRFEVGETLILKGAELQFFMPPTGVEVLLDEEGRHVRDAVTLQRLEYCVLIGEDGRKEFVRGEAVVFPSPTQRFLSRSHRNGRTTPAMQAIELSETTGLHIKVVAPYTDEDGDHVEGNEIFITGSNQIYFPREEHAIVRYGQHVLHQAVAIPRGDGRYLLDRKVGEVSVVNGPRMLLPDPRRHVVIRRVLTDRESRLLYPGNDEALSYNRRLRRGGGGRERLPSTSGGEALRTMAEAAIDVLAVAPPDATGQDIERASEFVEPRTITLDTSYSGVVSVDVWSGHAVQVVDRVGARRVVVGPATVMLAFDETLAALSMSTGTPKTDGRLLETGYLNITGNKVSDLVEVATADMVELGISVVYRVSFEGPTPDQWFSVDNYVKLLCDRAGSIIKATLRKTSVMEVRTRVTDLIRDALLGPHKDDEERRGLAFEENGMRLYDVDVLDVAVIDEAIDELLVEAQVSAIQQAIEVSEAETKVACQLRVSALRSEALRTAHQAKQLEVELAAALASQERAVAAERQRGLIELHALEQDDALEEARRRAELVVQEVAITRSQADVELSVARDRQTLRLEELEARVEAASRHAQSWSPALVEAVQRLGNEQLLASLSENFGELAAVEGKGLLETARKFLDFVPNGFMPVLGRDADSG